ncbi:MAG: hypothetical protein R3B84_04225 [Zavarzinella sp.]
METSRESSAGLLLSGTAFVLALLGFAASCLAAAPVGQLLNIPFQHAAQSKQLIWLIAPAVGSMLAVVLGYLAIKSRSQQELHYICTGFAVFSMMIGWLAIAVCTVIAYVQYVYPKMGI